MTTPLRLLIVEDSEDDALLLERELTKNGYDLESQRVDTPEAMQRALAEKKWDIVISDFVMPRFSGQDALQMLKESGIGIPFIIISGKIGEETAVEAMRAGVNDYIIKGNLARLAPAVEREMADAEVRRKRRQAEDALRESEKALRAMMLEKEVLLKEIHHRIKNNLQLISSMISLESDTLADERLQRVLGDINNRIRTIGLVHEELNQANDHERLEFSEYAGRIMQYLWAAHNTATEKVRLNLLLAPLMLPVNSAMHCGLILNELTTNAIKYGFPGGREGEVSVLLEHDPATGAVCLRVRDNGVGLPADLDWQQSSSLGLRLVQLLATQMHGTVQAGSGPGTEFRIRFNVKEISS